MKKIILALTALAVGVNLYGSTDTLHIAVYDSPPFGMEVRGGRIGGLMVELWEDIADDLEYNYTYTLTDMNGLITGLQEKKYDVGLGAISITPKREKLVDFTHAVNPSGTGIATFKDSTTHSFFKKWGPILLDLLELFAGLFIMLMISAVIVYYIEHRYITNEVTEKDINSVSDGLWWAAVTMTTVGYGDKVPRSKAGKVLGIVWIFISIIFFSLFTANASAKLANFEAQSTINSIDDLRDITVLAVSKSSGEEYLLREHLDYLPVNSITDALDSLVAGKADAVVSNVPVLKYHNKFNYNNNLLISNEYLLRNNMGMTLQEESPLKEMIDEVLLEKISEAKWQSAVYRWIGDVE